MPGIYPDNLLYHIQAHKEKMLPTIANAKQENPANL